MKGNALRGQRDYQHERPTKALLWKRRILFLSSQVVKNPMCSRVLLTALSATLPTLVRGNTVKLNVLWSCKEVCKIIKPFQMPA